eukprot:UN29852
MLPKIKKPDTSTISSKGKGFAWLFGKKKKSKDIKVDYVFANLNKTLEKIHERIEHLTAKASQCDSDAKKV